MTESTPLHTTLGVLRLLGIPSAMGLQPTPPWQETIGATLDDFLAELTGTIIASGAEIIVWGEMPHWHGSMVVATFWPLTRDDFERLALRPRGLVSDPEPAGAGALS